MNVVDHTTTIEPSVLMKGSYLSLSEIYAIARAKSNVRIADDKETIARLIETHVFIQQESEKQKPIYGVNTGFGGMGNCVMPHEDATKLQNNLFHFLKTGVGDRLPDAQIRAGMTIIANALLKGVSGIRYEIVERYGLFLNKRVVPDVRNLGSIGASGDLVPLSSVAGVITGHSESFTAYYNGKTFTAPALLKELGLEQIELLPKEGLAMVNSTAMLTGIATVNVMEWRNLLTLSLYAHAMMMEAFVACIQPFDPFVHKQKPHAGQVWIADRMFEILNPSSLIRSNGELIGGEQRLYQDRYSIRCVPQFIGPMLDAFKLTYQQVQTEANSVGDNPIVDIKQRRIVHGGNFMGEYISLGMDQLRNHIGIMAKHLDTQMAMLMAPEFSDGLPASLCGNPDDKTNMGLKGLQITGNSIVPLLLFYGNSIADKFQTHAEQFNQNINSQGFNAAVLTGKSIEMFRQYVSIALIVATQALDLRTKKVDPKASVREIVSPFTYPVYAAVRQICNKAENNGQPLVYNDKDQSLQQMIMALNNSIQEEGALITAAQPLLCALDNYINAAE